MNKLKLWILTNITIPVAAINEGAAKTEIQNIFTPINNIMLWAVPLVTTATCLWAWYRHSGRDEEEREQKPLRKQLFNIIKWAMLIEMLSVILKIFGIA